MSDIQFKYFYGKESELFTFYRIPKELITNPRFKSLSNDAKLLYGLMLDRMALSAKNKWFDKYNRVYIYFSVVDVMEQLNIGRNKAIKLFKELDDESGIGLIERKQQGQGKPAIIYVKSFVIEDDNVYSKEFEKQTAKSLETKLQEVSDINSNNNKEINTNVDIKSNHILVQRSVTRIDGDKWGIGEDTKTPSGKRKIPLTEDVRAILDRQKQLNQIRKGNNIVEMEELIFVGARGGLIEGQYVNQEIKNICEYLGIAIFTTHAFRDTFATRAIENNMNPKTLQEILGHKDYAMTMNLYAHALDETKEQEMNNLKISI